jgi:hypothetical protein
MVICSSMIFVQHASRQSELGQCGHSDEQEQTSSPEQLAVTALLRQMWIKMWITCRTQLVAIRVICALPSTWCCLLTVIPAALCTAEAEAAYNLGRAAHEVGLLHVAVAHYERVLQLDQQAAAEAAAQQLERLSLQQQQQGSGDQQDMQLDGEQQAGATQDIQQQKQQGQNSPQQQQQTSEQQGLQQLGRGLVREAAHNLCMIYKGSGADDLARQIMRKYLTL